MSWHFTCAHSLARAGDPKVLVSLRWVSWALLYSISASWGNSCRPCLAREATMSVVAPGNMSMAGSSHQRPCTQVWLANWMKQKSFKNNWSTCEASLPALMGIATIRQRPRKGLKNFPFMHAFTFPYPATKELMGANHHLQNYLICIITQMNLRDSFSLGPQSGSPCSQPQEDLKPPMQKQTAQPYLHEGLHQSHCGQGSAEVSRISSSITQGLQNPETVVQGSLCVGDVVTDG